MKISTALEISAACITEDKSDLKRPKGVSYFDVMWALRTLSSSYQLQKRAREQDRDERNDKPYLLNVLRDILTIEANAKKIGIGHSSQIYNIVKEALDSARKRSTAAKADEIEECLHKIWKLKDSDGNGDSKDLLTYLEEIKYFAANEKCDPKFLLQLIDEAATEAITRAKKKD